MWRYALLLCACWTGPEPAETLPSPAPASPRSSQLVVTMERTACFGNCPVYKVEIRGNGDVKITSGSTVTQKRVARSAVERLARKVETTHFFDLDDQGHPPAQAQCVTTGSTTTCSIHSFTLCTDTSHAIITVRRGAQTHTVDDAHCSDDHWLGDLEDEIDTLAGMKIDI